MKAPARRGAEEFRFSEVLSALSRVLDLVEGQPEGHAVRSCLIGKRVADRLGLDVDARSALFYALLLKDAGCSSNASKMFVLFDADDIEVKRKVKTVDWTSLPSAALYTARAANPGGRCWTKPVGCTSSPSGDERLRGSSSRSAASGGRRLRASWASRRRRRRLCGPSTSTGTAGATRTALGGGDPAPGKDPRPGPDGRGLLLRPRPGRGRRRGDCS